MACRKRPLMGEIYWFRPWDSAVDQEGHPDTGSVSSNQHVLRDCWPDWTGGQPFRYYRQNSDWQIRSTSIRHWWHHQISLKQILEPWHKWTATIWRKEDPQAIMPFLWYKALPNPVVVTVWKNLIPWCNFKRGNNFIYQPRDSIILACQFSWSPQLQQLIIL